MSSEYIKPYDQNAAKKQQVSTMFNNIAKHYDFLNRFLSLGIDVRWRKRAVAELVAQRPQKVLDVATGTGDVAIEIAQTIRPASIVGVDISTEMLEIGRKKIRERSLHSLIAMNEGDSENLVFDDHAFDAATVAFGVRNFENLEKGLREIWRVLKPEGQLVVLEFSQPTIFPFKQIYHFYFKNILPLVGKVVSKDAKAYQYLFESVQAFPSGAKFEELLKQVGFKTTHSIPLTFGICSIYIGKK